MTIKKPADTLKTGKRGGKTKTSWKPGQSGNPKGGPKRGQSWAEVIQEIGEMTPDEARKMSEKIFSQVRLGDAITLKQAVVMRVYAAMLFEPQPGLVNAFMDRADGRVKDVIEHDGNAEKPIEVVVRYATDNRSAESTQSATGDQATGETL